MKAHSVAQIIMVAAVSVFVSTRPVEAQAAGRSNARGGSRLFREMQTTGKPALVIAGNVGCVHCRKMAAELESNAALQQYVEQMFVVKVDTDSREWPVLRNEFQFEGKGIPAVFFVRADGKLLYGESGRPRDLEGFLKARLTEAGTPLDPETMKAMQREAGQLLRARKRDDWPTIVELVKKRSGSGSFAAPALAFDEAASAVTEKALSDITSAEAQLANDMTRVQGAMALMAAEKLFAGYEPAKDTLAPAIEKARQDEVTAQLLEDAKRLNEAAELESRRRRVDAAKIYEQLIVDRKGSPAAAFAEERLDDLP